MLINSEQGNSVLAKKKKKKGFSKSANLGDMPSTGDKKRTE